MNIQNNTVICTCSGSLDSQSKHPLVYLHVNDSTATICPYCSKSFIINTRNDKAYLEASEHSTG